MKAVVATPEIYMGVMDGGIPHIVEPLKSLGHDAILFDNLKYGDKEFIELINNFKPDFIYCGLIENQLSYDTLKYIKDNTDSVIINWFCDDAWRFNNFSSKYCTAFDYVVTTDKESYIKYKKQLNYNNVMLSTFFCSPKIFYPIETEKIYDVTFIGRVHGDRQKMFDIKI